MKSVLSAFIGGAIVGGAVALLFAPESGEQLRERIKQTLKKKGLDFSDVELDDLVSRFMTQIKGK
ncbi:MAG: YtxH domain-containing protein [Muribaculaceae bacterium]|nr:YtxH domain-containing protein [Muribaculaceae bacterium]